MILRTRCPSCSSTYRLRMPPPAEGRKYRCTCGTVITVSYPDQVKEYLKSKGLEIPSLDESTEEPAFESEETEAAAEEDAEEMDTLVDLPAATRTRPKEPLKKKEPAPGKRQGRQAPPMKEGDELVRMNIVGDGGAGLTRPPRLDPMPHNEPQTASSIGTREVQEFLAAQDTSTPRGDDESRPSLTSPSDLVNLPSLEDSLRLEPESHSMESGEGQAAGLVDQPTEEFDLSASREDTEESTQQDDAPIVEEPTIVDSPTDEFELPSAGVTAPPAEEVEEATVPEIPEISPQAVAGAPGGGFLPGPDELDGIEPSSALDFTPPSVTPPPAQVSIPDEETAALPEPAPAAAVTARKSGAGTKSGWSGGSAFDRKKKKRAKVPARKTEQKLTIGKRILRTLKWVAIIGTLLAVIGVGAIAAVIGYYAQDVPDVDVLGTYSPPTVTQVRSSDGVLLGEFFEQQRYVTPIEEIPKNLQNAFVSAEDAAFWEHEGLDYLGIVRAALKNIEEGRMAQGASTITQQVARSFLLTREKKLDRKLKEAILAHKIENNFEKDYILFLYLNQIFLGHGAYGVQAASKLYFDKDVKELSLAECAIIAGLPQAPSRYSPNKNFQKAKQRQSYVLDQMVDKGYISRKEADDAFAEKLVFSRKHNKNLVIAPYYVEHVRKYLNETYGEKTVNREGLQVVVPLDVGLQKAASKAVKDGVRRSDKIMGYRGAISKLQTPADIVKEKHRVDRKRTLKALPYNPAFKLPKGAVAQSLIPPLQPGEIVKGVVSEVGRTWAVVDVGSHRGVLPVSEFSWCHRVNPERNFRYFTCKTLDDTLFPGDLIEVRVVNAEEDWRKTLGKSWKGTTKFARLAMEQPPRPEAALVSLRVSDGAIISMVGGKDYLGSEFNRAMQAKRQMGSTIKPFCYAAALDHPSAGITPSSIFLDAPIVEESRGKLGKVWAPKNAGGSFEGDTTLRRGLMLSRNTITLKILQATGVGYTVDYLTRFGFELGREESNQSMCLGTASRTPLQLAEAYTPFPTLGDRRSSYFVSEVRDRNGTVLEARSEGELEEDVIEPGTAYQMVRLMRDVVQSGTARKAMELGVPLSGKTGTTNNFQDAWFVGYTPELVTVAWVGLDSSEGMGKGQYGGDVALPIWIDFMSEGIKKYPPSKYTQPEDIVMTLVDSKTGLLVRKGELGAWTAFKKGTEPTKYTPAPDAVDTASFLTGEF